MNFIISGPGRCGGHLLEGIIRSTGQTSVHRTHDPALDLGDDLNTTLIVLDRRDRFSAMMSNAIVRHTGQSTDYPNKQIRPFELAPGLFRWEYAQYIDYYRRHDLSRLYAGVVKFYLEDFVSDHGYVKRALNLPDLAVKKGSDAWKLMNNSAPYHYEDIISNWNQLKTFYLRLRVGADVDGWE